MAASNPGGSSPNGGKPSRLSFTIASENGAIRDVQRRILDEVSRFGFNHQSIFAIKLALEESMINAIKHGNKYDKDKKVRILTVITPSQAEITIEDEGPGFRRDEVPDPTFPGNIEKCSGRGILLIESYMDQVEWTKGGRRVHMVIKNKPDLHPRG